MENKKIDKYGQVNKKRSIKAQKPKLVRRSGIQSGMVSLGDDALLRRVLLSNVQGNAHAAEDSGRWDSQHEQRLLSGIDWKRAGKDVRELHGLYTGSGGVSYQGVDNPLRGRELGYQLYYLPRNLHRVRCVLRGLPWWHGSKTDGKWLLCHWLGMREGLPTLSWLDLGCGTGAFSLAWLQWLVRLGAPAEGWPQLEVTLVDQSHYLLKKAERQLQLYVGAAMPGASLRVKAVAEGIAPWLARTATDEKFCLVGAAMSLAELGLLGPRRKSERSKVLLQALRARMLAGGMMLFVEPGVRKGYLHLMMLHPLLRQHPILYPCPHQQPCPMWRPNAHHWCHVTERIPNRFFFDEALQQRGGLDFHMRDLHLAALAVQYVEGSSTPPFRLQHGERIVSGYMPWQQAFNRLPKPTAPQKPFSSQACWACTPTGQLQLRAAHPEDTSCYRGAWWSLPSKKHPSLHEQ